MKKYFIIIVIFIFYSMTSFSNNQLFKHGEICLDMDKNQFLELIKDYHYINVDKTYLIADYYDASVLIDIGEDDKIQDITIKMDVIDLTKEFFELVKTYSKIYGKPIKHDKEKYYYEFVKDSKIVVLKCNKTETNNYIILILFSKSRDTKGYKNLLMD